MRTPFYKAKEGVESATTTGIATNGSYYFRVPNLTAGSTYYFRQIAIAPSGKTAVTTGHFNSSTAYVPPGTTSEQDDFENRSYRLLTPFPGLAVLLNPDLCLEMIQEGKIAPDNKICTKEDPSGFSGFLNYIFRLIIGIAAVLLVLRLIFEGYRYATTDVPFLKTSAKSGIGQAFTGLLLALSAWLLLNTINPKLVSNTISLQSLKVTLDDLEGDNDTYQTALTYTAEHQDLRDTMSKRQRFQVVSSVLDKQEVPLPLIRLQKASSGKSPITN